MDFKIKLVIMTCEERIIIRDYIFNHKFTSINKDIIDYTKCKHDIVSKSLSISIIDKIKNYANIFGIAQCFKNHSVDNLTKEELVDYLTTLTKAYKEYGRLCNSIISDIKKLLEEKLEKENEQEDDGLENLTKEELIAKLREKK